MAVLVVGPEQKAARLVRRINLAVELTTRTAVEVRTQGAVRRALSDGSILVAGDPTEHTGRVFDYRSPRAGFHFLENVRTRSLRAFVILTGFSPAKYELLAREARAAAGAAELPSARYTIFGAACAEELWEALASVTRRPPDGTTPGPEASARTAADVLRQLAAEQLGWPITERALEGAAGRVIWPLGRPILAALRELRRAYLRAGDVPGPDGEPGSVARVRRAAKAFEASTGFRLTNANGAAQLRLGRTLFEFATVEGDGVTPRPEAPTLTLTNVRAAARPAAPFTTAPRAAAREFTAAPRARPPGGATERPRGPPGRAPPDAGAPPDERAARGSAPGPEARPAPT